MHVESTLAAAGTGTTLRIRRPYGSSDRLKLRGAQSARDSSGILNLPEIRAVAFRLHLVSGNEPQRHGVYAIPQTATVWWAVGKHVPQMAVGMHRPYL